MPMDKVLKFHLIARNPAWQIILEREFQAKRLDPCTFELTLYTGEVYRWFRHNHSRCARNVDERIMIRAAWALCQHDGETLFAAQSYVTPVQLNRLTSHEYREIYENDIPWYAVVDV